MYFIQSKLREMHEAIMVGSLNTIKQLLDREQYVSMKDGSGLTPVHKAVLYARQDIAHYMLNSYPDAANALDNVSQ